MSGEQQEEYFPAHWPRPQRREPASDIRISLDSELREGIGIACAIPHSPDRLALVRCVRTIPDRGNSSRLAGVIDTDGD
ncbi:MAG TPA: hypothetical protein VF928_09625 [Usitatibacteraceae bacterium]